LLKKVIIVLAGLMLLATICVEAAETTIKLVINGQPASVEPEPTIREGRVMVPVRFIAEHLGAQVKWDDANKTVNIDFKQGDSYLKGQNNSSGTSTGTMSNFISASELKDILDDDKDNDLADYRQGHNGGDQIANDPLVVDLRKQDEYNAKHIPGAVWLADAENMAESQNLQKLKDLLDEHVAKGSKQEIVVYCYTGNLSGLVAGVLGSQGLPVKSMKYGFDIAWQGTKKADKPILVPMEDSNGKAVQCGG